MASQITPSSEILHLVNAVTDTLDSLPPSLTRNLSDLKELDAVLSGSLQTITNKLQLLFTMMNTPPPNSPEAANAPTFTPLERLKLLREVTEDARVFRLGGEDKIRVATGTCETIATHTAHLSTLSTLLLSFLPAHLLPMLPPPSAPHGYPSSVTPSSALTRRQIFDYPVANHPGAGSTSRMNGALGMVREHWEQTRGRVDRPLGGGGGGGGGGGATSGKRKAAGTSHAHGHGHHGHGGGGDRDDRDKTQKDLKEKDPNHRHPNQYTKKKLAAAAAAAATGNPASGGGSGGGIGGGLGNVAAPYSAVPVHPMGMTAVEAVKSKRGTSGEGGGNGAGASGTASRSNAAIAGGMGYSGMASLEEYNAATQGQRATKRKPEDNGAASKRRKKTGDASPDVVPRTIPTTQAVASGSSLKAPRRTSNTKMEEVVSPAVIPLPIEEELLEGEGEDDVDGHTYCFCDRVSFGEMIGCDGSECDREWFHLSCVGLQAIPKGRWFCDDCRKRISDKAGKKRR